MNQPLRAPASYDFVVAGGGIVGLATAWRITEQQPGARVLVLEKEAGVARHQTGRNSGVMHSGIYYKPGTDKARLCRTGYRQLVAFAEQYGMAHDVCGKVIVATAEEELPRLQVLEDRAAANGLAAVTRLDGQGLRAIEPEAAGIAALHVPETGIIDYVAVCRQLVKLIEAAGSRVAVGQKVVALQREGGARVVVTDRDRYLTRYFINCGGQYSDRLARLDGVAPDLLIAPFRGEYYAFKSEAPVLVRHLIYPVPDPAFPFLGGAFHSHGARRHGVRPQCGVGAGTRGLWPVLVQRGRRTGNLDVFGVPEIGQEALADGAGRISPFALQGGVRQGAAAAGAQGGGRDARAACGGHSRPGLEGRRLAGG